MCKMCDRWGQAKCPHHRPGVDLAARNRKVAAAARRNNPERYYKQKSAAGKMGFEATAAKHGRDFAIEFARRWRENNPSGPERRCAELLDALGVDYLREVAVAEVSGAIDFLILSEHSTLIEVNGHQWRPAFGESEPRQDRHDEKVATLRSAGFRVIVLDYRQENEWPEQLAGLKGGESRAF